MIHLTGFTITGLLIFTLLVCGFVIGSIFYILRKIDTVLYLDLISTIGVTGGLSALLGLADYFVRKSRKRDRKQTSGR